jgi:cysteine synthase A
MNEEVKVVLADPEGSGLYNKVGVLTAAWHHLTHLQVKHGVMYDRREAEGTKRRHQVDTVVEGMSVQTSFAIPI